MLATTILRATAIAAALAVSAIAVPAAAQPNPVHGPYYATPSWDQTFPTHLRFIVLANMNSEAVLDRETGLVWQRSPDATARDWQNALYHCADLALGGRKGWRLPGIQELASLVDPTVGLPGPTLPAGHPFLNVQSSLYWSASTVAVGAASARVVLFNQGNVFGNDKSATSYVWCVRGGQGPDPH